MCPVSVRLKVTTAKTVSFLTRATSDDHFGRRPAPSVSVRKLCGSAVNAQRGEVRLEELLVVLHGQ